MRGWMTLYFFIIVPRTYMHGFITSHYLDDLYATAAWPYTTRRQHRHWKKDHTCLIIQLPIAVPLEPGSEGGDCPSHREGGNCLIHRESGDWLSHRESGECLSHGKGVLSYISRRGCVDCLASSRGHLAILCWNLVCNQTEILKSEITSYPNSQMRLDEQAWLDTLVYILILHNCNLSKTRPHIRCVHGEQTDITWLPTKGLGSVWVHVRPCDSLVTASCCCMLHPLLLRSVLPHKNRPVDRVVDFLLHRVTEFEIDSLIERPSWRSILWLRDRVRDRFSDRATEFAIDSPIERPS